MESGYQYSEEIINYLLKLCKHLPRSTWNDGVKSNRIDTIPTPEKFSFCLNTLLSDIALCFPTYRDEIIQTQVEVLSTLSNLIRSSKESSGTTTLICKTTLPITIGLCRSLGRYSFENTPLLCRLFPKPNDFKLNQNERYVSCQNVQNNLSKKYLLTPTACFSHSFFHEPGSSFYQIENFDLSQSDNNKELIIPIQHLQTIFLVAKKLLTREVLDHLDQVCQSEIETNDLSCGYKSFSEILNLVLVSLLREILHNQSNLPGPFTKDVREFVKRLFQIGQTELQSKPYDNTGKDVTKFEVEDIRRYKLNVLANATCVDLLVWAISDEAGE